MGARALVAAGVAVIAVGLAVALTQSSSRPAGTNYVGVFEPTPELRNGEKWCQEDEIVPRGAASLRLLVGSPERPLPDLRVTIVNGEGRALSTGRREGSGPERDGTVEVPLHPEIDRSVVASRVCVRLEGSPRMALLGSGGRTRFVWMRDGRESWLTLLPTVAHRFALGKSHPFGDLLLWIVALAVVSTAACGLWILARELHA